MTHSASVWCDASGSHASHAAPHMQVSGWQPVRGQGARARIVSTTAAHFAVMANAVIAGVPRFCAACIAATSAVRSRCSAPAVHRVQLPFETCCVLRHVVTLRFPHCSHSWPGLRISSSRSQSIVSLLCATEVCACRPLLRRRQASVANLLTHFLCAGAVDSSSVGG